jgi:hypothetical protein
MDKLAEQKHNILLVCYRWKSSDALILSCPCAYTLFRISFILQLILLGIVNITTIGDVIIGILVTISS